jgi:hypothetical protein
MDKPTPGELNQRALALVTEVCNNALLNKQSRMIVDSALDHLAQLVAANAELQAVIKRQGEQCAGLEQELESIKAKPNGNADGVEPN